MTWEIIIFFIVSVLLSMVGVGGGIFYVPLLLFPGYDFAEAATISLFLITITGFSAFLRYRKAGMVDWKPALVMETFTDTGAGNYSCGYCIVYDCSCSVKVTIPVQ